MTDTVNLKVFRGPAVARICDYMEMEDGEDNQKVADLFATAVLSAEMIGWDTTSMIQLICTQQKEAEKLLEEEQE